MLPDRGMTFPLEKQQAEDEKAPLGVCGVRMMAGRSHRWELQRRNAAGVAEGFVMTLPVTSCGCSSKVDLWTIHLSSKMGSNFLSRVMTLIICQISNVYSCSQVVLKHHDISLNSRRRKTSHFSS